MIVCLCMGLSDRKIKKMISEGNSDLASLRRCSNVTLGCGKCLNFVKSMLQKNQGLAPSHSYVINRSPPVLSRMNSEYDLSKCEELNDVSVEQRNNNLIE